MAIPQLFAGGVEMRWCGADEGLRVARVTWPDGGRHGALGRAALDGLRTCLAGLDTVDREDTAVVLAGSGTDFSAGADLRDVLSLASVSQGERQAYSGQVQDLVDTFDRVPCLTAVAIEGYALGLGFELALAADLRWAAADARVGLPEARLGLLPAATGTVRLLETLGPLRGLDWLLEGRIAHAPEALAAGLLNGVAAPRHASVTVEAWIRSHASVLLLGPMARGVRREATGPTHDGARRAEREAFARLLGQDTVRSRIEERLGLSKAKAEPETNTAGRIEPI